MAPRRGYSEETRRGGAFRSAVGVKPPWKYTVSGDRTNPSEIYETACLGNRLIPGPDNAECRTSASLQKFAYYRKTAAGSTRRGWPGAHAGPRRGYSEKMRGIRPFASAIGARAPCGRASLRRQVIGRQLTQRGTRGQKTDSNFHVATRILERHLSFSESSTLIKRRGELTCSIVSWERPGCGFQK